MTSAELHGKMLISSFTQQVMDWVPMVGPATKVDPGDSADTQEVASGLEAHTGTLDHNLVLIPLYLDGETSFFQSLRRIRMVFHYIYLSHCTLQVCYGLNVTTSATLGAKTIVCIILSVGKYIPIFRHQPSLQTCKLGRVWVGKYEQRLFSVSWDNLCCPTSKMLTISWSKHLQSWRQYQMRYSA